MALVYIFTTLFILYSILVIYYWRAFISIPDTKDLNEEIAIENSLVYISVIIPARNEEDNIGILLNALQEQTLSQDRFEVIVINDHSTDKTSEMVSQFPNVKLLDLEENSINSYKKKAIEIGIAAASGELIITTDADCVPAKTWLQTIARCKNDTQAGFIVAPVVFQCNSSMVQIFQAMDFMILQGITAAAVYKGIHSMCNGANLAYEKKLFYDVKGFEGIDDIASGDDMLLMHKIAKKFPGRIKYLKSAEAIVSTRPMKTWGAFINQRIRWASKATHYKDKKILHVLLLVYFFNFSFLILLIVGFWIPFYWLLFLCSLLLKAIVEFPFFSAVSQFYKNRYPFFLFFSLQPIHIYYTIISGILGQIVKYEWKGRTVK